jgi:8-oxo-dGTP diphosphatase
LRADEDLDGCARRLLRAQIGVVAEAVAQFGLYSSPTPNLDERVVSVAYVAGARDVERPQLTASDMRAEWRPVRPLPRNLVRGHAGVVRDALKYLEPIAETNPGPRLLPMLFALLPDKFTFARLHSAYEAILGRSVDKRNFRKVLLDARHVVETEAFERGSHRPARLYVRS